MEKVIIIHEFDFEDSELDVLGVCSSVENCYKVIDEYYGENEYIITQNFSVRICNIIREIHIKVLEDNSEYRLTLEYFNIDKI